MKNPESISRRRFLECTLLVMATSAFLPARDFLGSRGWLEVAQAQPVDLVHDTFNGLLAFIVPGPDAYSLAQGVSTKEVGGVDAGVVDVLIATIDQSTPFVPSFSGTVATILNQLAQVVKQNADATFARLAFAEKAAVFQIMDATDSLKLLGGLLPLFAAFFCYSEAGVFDPVTRSLTGRPVGWQLSNYEGVSDGRNEFVGYFDNSQG